MQLKFWAAKISKFILAENEIDILARISHLCHILLRNTSCLMGPYPGEFRNSVSFNKLNSYFYLFYLAINNPKGNQGINLIEKLKNWHFWKIIIGLND